MCLLLNKSRWCCNKLFTEVHCALGEFLFTAAFTLNVDYKLLKWIGNERVNCFKECKPMLDEMPCLKFFTVAFPQFDTSNCTMSICTRDFFIKTWSLISCISPFVGCPKLYCMCAACVIQHICTPLIHLITDLLCTF